MNLIFLTLSKFIPENEGIYTDLMSCFVKHGHKVTVVCPCQRREKTKTSLTIKHGMRILNVSTLNITGVCSIFEKGVGTLLLEQQYISAIKKYLPYDSFDCILFSTPPVTFAKTIEYIKKKYHAVAYLLLKDIFPQNAVDLHYFSKNSLFYRFFKYKERKLYSSADYIGCMSPANKHYIEMHEPYLDRTRIEVNPNSKFYREYKKDMVVRASFGVPVDKVVFIYGGNLGRPQGIEFLCDCIKTNEQRSNSFFLIVGEGNERDKLEKLFANNNLKNSLLLPYLNANEYNELCACCDVGLIFLNKEFTIPNFPSRTLSYMQVGMPYIAAVDTSTDVGTIAEEHCFGLNCLWGDLDAFNAYVEYFATNLEHIANMGKRAKEYFLSHYTVEHSYEIIMKHFENREDYVQK